MGHIIGQKIVAKLRKSRFAGHVEQLTRGLHAGGCVVSPCVSNDLHWAVLRGMDPFPIILNLIIRLRSRRDLETSPQRPSSPRYTNPIGQSQKAPECSDDKNWTRTWIKVGRPTPLGVSDNLFWESE